MVWVAPMVVPDGLYIATEWRKKNGILSHKNALTKQFVQNFPHPSSSYPHNYYYHFHLSRVLCSTYKIDIIQKPKKDLCIYYTLKMYNIFKPRWWWWWWHMLFRNGQLLTHTKQNTAAHSTKNQCVKQRI